MSLELINANSKQDLPEYLDFLYGGLEGYIATATKHKTDDGNVTFQRQSFSWPDQRTELTDWIIGTSATVDVYIAPAIFKAPSGRKEDFHASKVVWS